MQVKKKKSVAERKAKDKTSKTEKARVQERLLALDAYRKSQNKSKDNKVHRNRILILLLTPFLRKWMPGLPRKMGN